jgi:voltage-gated potassium channel
VFASSELMIANAFLIGAVVFGRVGYMFLEGWTFQDSLYMTFLTLTTIGFAEVHELSGAGRMAQVLLRPHVDRFMERVLRS